MTDERLSRSCSNLPILTALRRDRLFRIPMFSECHLLALISQNPCHIPSFSSTQGRSRTISKAPLLSYVQLKQDSPSPTCHLPPPTQPLGNYFNLSFPSLSTTIRPFSGIGMDLSRGKMSAAVFSLPIRRLLKKPWISWLNRAPRKRRAALRTSGEMLPSALAHAMTFSQR